jgi:uncharacterized protein YyaL (SSP411 family)
VWSAAEVRQILGPERARVFASVYDVTDEGNWEGHNILNRSRAYAQDAALLGLDEAEMRQQLDEARKKLYEARSRRVWPGRDDKVLTSWNGLIITALANASQVLGVDRYAEAASRAADFLLTRLRQPDGRILRTWSAGAEPKLNGYLEDYAFLLEGLVALFEATGVPRWIAEALELAGVLQDQFSDPSGGFFYTGRDHEALIARTKDAQDSSIPSGNGLAATALLRLARLTGLADLRQTAATTLEHFSGLLAQAPQAAAQLLIALDFHLGPVQEVAVIGDPAGAPARDVLRLVHRNFRPNKVVAFKDPRPTPELETVVPLLADRPSRGDVTTYICENFTCQAPLVGVEAVRSALTSGEPRA